MYYHNKKSYDFLHLWDMAEQIGQKINAEKNNSDYSWQLFCPPKAEFPSINFCHQTVPVSVIQPLDQGIIRLFKFHYRKFSLKSIGDCIDLQNKKPTEALSRITKMAWNKVLKESFKNCFHYGFYGSSKDAPDDASQETVELQQVHQQADVTDVTSGMFHIFSWIYF